MEAPLQTNRRNLCEKKIYLTLRVKASPTHDFFPVSLSKRVLADEFSCNPKTSLLDVRLSARGRDSVHVYSSPRLWCRIRVSTSGATARREWEREVFSKIKIDADQQRGR